MTNRKYYRRPTEFDGAAAKTSVASTARAADQQSNRLGILYPLGALCIGAIIGIYYSSFEITNLQDHLASAEQQNGDTIGELNNEVDELGQELARLEQTLSDANTLLETNREGTALLESERRSALAQIVDLQSSIQAFEAEIEAQRSSLATTQSSMEQANEQIAQYEQDISTLNTSLEQKDAELERLQGQLSEAVRARDQATSDFAKAEADLSALEDEVEALRTLQDQQNDRLSELSVASDFLDQFALFTGGPGFVFFGFVDSSDPSTGSLTARSFEFSRDTAPTRTRFRSDLAAMTVFSSLPVSPSSVELSLDNTSPPINFHSDLVADDDLWKVDPNNISGLMINRPNLEISRIHVVEDQVWLEFCAGTGCN